MSPALQKHYKCERQFYVGHVSDSDIKAEFRNGVLRLSVPKSEEKKEQKKLINIDQLEITSFLERKYT